MSQALAPRLMPMKSSCSATKEALRMYPDISVKPADGPQLNTRSSLAEHCHTLSQNMLVCQALFL